MKNGWSNQETWFAFIYLTNNGEPPAQWAEMSIDDLAMLLEGQMSDPVYYAMPSS